MRESGPSHTAFRVATHRAVHQMLDVPRVFDDPLALTILGPDKAAEVRAHPARFDRSPLARGMRAFVVARSRFAEDALADAVARGVTQYVVLGAGLDTFAYRNPFPALRVFEVDHPATQAWKRARLADAGIAVPETLTFTAVDFQKESLEAGLGRAGFDRGRPAFLSWLGVTIYLPEAIVRGTFAFVARLPPSSGLVFDFAKPPGSLNWFERQAFKLLEARVASIGEPWVTYFEPAPLAANLADMGFHDVQMLDAAAVNARYFANRSDRLRVGHLAHLALARTG
jgi:methyltransferase (TIGR00027 family)